MTEEVDEMTLSFKRHSDRYEMFSTDIKIGIPSDCSTPVAVEAFHRFLTAVGYHENSITGAMADFVRERNELD